MSEQRNFQRRSFLSFATMGLAASIADSARAKSIAIRHALRRSLTPSLSIEGELPSFQHATEWMTSQPVDRASLHGKVVLVSFWTYTYINWLRTLPYVRAWAQKYRDQLDASHIGFMLAICISLWRRRREVILSGFGS